MTDLRPRMPSQEPAGFEIIDGIEYNTTPSRSLQKLSPEDRELWLAMAADMEQEIRARCPGHSRDTWRDSRSQSGSHDPGLELSVD